MENQRPISNPSESTPSQAKKKTNLNLSDSKWLKIGILFIFLVLIPTGIYLLNQNSTVRFTKQNQETFLNVPAYGVKFKLSDDIKDAYYYMDTGSAYLKVHSLDSIAGCDTDKSFVAALSRVGKNETSPISGNRKYSEAFNGAVIGNYFYFINLAQSACNDTPEGLAKLEKIRKAFTNASTTITEIN